MAEPDGGGREERQDDAWRVRPGAVGAVAMAVGMVVLIALFAAIIALSPEQLSGEGDWNEEQVRVQAGIE